MSDAPWGVNTVRSLVQRRAAERGGSVEFSDILFAAAQQGVHGDAARAALAWLESNGEITMDWHEIWPRR